MILKCLLILIVLINKQYRSSVKAESVISDHFCTGLSKVKLEAVYNP